MALNLDKKMLTGFSQEVRSYLPEIRAGIAKFRKNTTKPAALEGALRHIHTIKGASAMLGLSALSQAASHIESTLEEVVAGQLSSIAAQVECLALTVDHIEQYMDGLLAGNAPEQTIVTTVEELLQAFRSQPEGDETGSAAANLTTQLTASSVESTAAAAPDVDDDEAPTLLMDAALALSLAALDDIDTDGRTDTITIDVAATVTLDDVVADGLTDSISEDMAATVVLNVAAMEDVVTTVIPDDIAAEDVAATVTEILTPASAASLPVDEASLLPEETESLTTAMASALEDDFTTDPLLDISVAIPTEADTICMAPAADLPTETPAEDVPRAQTEATLASTLAAMAPEAPAPAAADEVSTALALPEDTVLAMTQAALETTDDFAADLLLNTAELDITALSPQDEPAAVTATDSADSPVELSAEALDTTATLDAAEPLTQTSGALDALIASIDDEIQRAYTTDAMSTVRQRAMDADSMSERYLLFTMHGRLYAVAVPHVLEVGRLPAITPVPNVPAWLRGVVNLRGEILSVIDVRTFLGFEEGHYTESSRMLVVKTLGDDMATSLVVDQVKGFVQLPKTSVQTPAIPFEDKVAPYLTGVCEYADQTLAVFDLERFLRSPEVRQFE